MAWFADYNISDLDRLAYSALAVSYSGIYQDIPAVQGYIGAPCIAAAVCNGQVLIAANNVWRTTGPGIAANQHMTPANEVAVNRGVPATADAPAIVNTTIFTFVVNFLRSEGIITPISFLENPLGESDRSYHAELQLIDYIQSIGGVFQGNAIGVSKPCCALCTVRLQAIGVNMTATHPGPTNAASPGPLPVISFTM